MIGFGAIGREVATALVDGRAGDAALVAVLVRDISSYRGVEDACVETLVRDRRVVFTDDPDGFFAAGPDLVVEVAGQNAVRQYGARVLAAGHDLMVASIGAFTDDALYDELRRLACTGGGRLLLIAGALPGVDWMQAAADAPVREVTITQTKPVTSWLGTPAEEMAALRGRDAAVCFFEGTARDAAATFPKSSNITAMLALATVGLDATRVRLVADPSRKRMHTRIDFDGEAGAVSITWEGKPSKTNPSTSADVSLAVIKAIRVVTAPIVFGV